MIDQLFNSLIQSSWQILLLSFIVWPLSRLSKRAYPNFAYILWVVVLVKALVPVNLTLPTQQIPSIVLSPVITGQFIQETAVSSNSSVSFKIILAALWSLGVLYLFGKLVLSELAHQKRMRMAQELSPESWFDDMKTDLGLKRDIRLYISESVQSPLMQGLWNVRIYLPRDYQSWTLDAKQSVLAHELTHVRRLDILVIYLQAMVRTLYFFHPIVWMVNDQIDLEREKICDDEAIEISKTERNAYGDQLFRQLAIEQEEKPIPVLAGGFFMSDSSIIKRFRYIKEKRGEMKNNLKVHHVLLILIVISLAVLIACNSEGANGTMTPTGLEKASHAGEKEASQVYDTPPEPKGGYSSIQMNVIYPELAMKNGITGQTILQVIINKLGDAVDPQVLRSSGNASLDSAAVSAVVLTEWIPAQMEGQAISAKISIPILFKLKKDKAEKEVAG